MKKTSVSEGIETNGGNMRTSVIGMVKKAASHSTNDERKLQLEDESGSDND